jgi:transaldolase
VGRLDDVAEDGMTLVEDIVEMFQYYDLTTQIIAASIRHPLHVVAAAKAGADIATVPLKIVKQMINHPLTDVGIVRFREDYRSVMGQQ